MKLRLSAEVTFELASAPKNSKPIQNTATYDKSAPAYLKVNGQSDKFKISENPVKLPRHVTIKLNENFHNCLKIVFC